MSAWVAKVIHVHLECQLAQKISDQASFSAILGHITILRSDDVQIEVAVEMSLKCYGLCDTRTKHSHNEYKAIETFV